MNPLQIQIELTPELNTAIEATMRFSGIDSKQAYIEEAIKLYEWAAVQLLHSRSIAAVDNFDGTVSPEKIASLEPLARIAEKLDRSMLTQEEFATELEEPGYPALELLAEMKKLPELANAHSNRPVFSGTTRSVGEIV